MAFTIAKRKDDFVYDLLNGEETKERTVETTNSIEFLRP